MKGLVFGLLVAVFIACNGAGGNNGNNGNGAAGGATGGSTGGNTGGNTGGGGSEGNENLEATKYWETGKCEDASLRFSFLEGSIFIKEMNGEITQGIVQVKIPIEGNMEVVSWFFSPDGIRHYSFLSGPKLVERESVRLFNSKGVKIASVGADPDNKGHSRIDFEYGQNKLGGLRIPLDRVLRSSFAGNNAEEICGERWPQYPLPPKPPQPDPRPIPTEIRYQCREYVINEGYSPSYAENECASIDTELELECLKYVRGKGYSPSYSKDICLDITQTKFTCLKDTVTRGYSPSYAKDSCKNY